MIGYPRAAAVLSAIGGLGFGVFCIPGIRNLWLGRDIPTVLGFPAYGGGPLERAGVPTTIPLLAGFLLVCALECAAAWWLWEGARGGAVLALALLPFGAFFWWGFALPFGWVFGLGRTTLIVMGWRALA